MAAALRPHGCRVSRCDSGWSGNFPSQECNNVTEIVPLLSKFSPLPPPSPLLSPRSFYFHKIRKKNSAPRFFVSPRCAPSFFFLSSSSFLFRRFISIVIIIVIIFGRLRQPDPARGANSKVESHRCRTAERKGGRPRWTMPKGAQQRGKPKRDIRVYRHASSFVRSRKQRPPRGALPFAALPTGA